MPHSDWADYVTKRIFYNTGFVYETHHGNYSFSSGAGRAFNRPRWLKLKAILDGARDESTDADAVKQGEIWKHMSEEPTVNCMDQAALLLICLSLGFSSPKDQGQLVCYNTSPFGFIKETDLVGWGRTNNPFFAGNRSRMIVKADDKNRSKFKRHIFST